MQEQSRRLSGSRDLILRFRVFGVDANAEKRNGQRAEHTEADSGKRVPSQVYGTQADGKGPEERGGLENVEHELAFHNLRSILVGLGRAGHKKQALPRNGSNRRKVPSGRS
jgi:hypothetical protein